MINTLRPLHPYSCQALRTKYELIYPSSILPSTHPNCDSLNSRVFHSWCSYSPAPLFVPYLLVQYICLSSPVPFFHSLLASIFLYSLPVPSYIVSSYSSPSLISTIPFLFRSSLQVSKSQVTVTWHITRWYNYSLIHLHPYLLNQVSASSLSLSDLTSFS